MSIKRRKVKKASRTNKKNPFPPKGIDYYPPSNINIIMISKLLDI